MKKILFLYTGGRQKRINEPENSCAKDFFYGFHEFQKLGYQVDFVERIIPQNYKPRNPRYQWLSFHNKWAASKLIMGNNAPFFLPHLEKIKQADIIIAIGDSIALAPEYYKLRRWIKGKIIHVSMGMANYWQEALVKKIASKSYVQWYYNRLLKQADSIITLGVAETELMRLFFPKHARKIKFVPFGIDIGFWQASQSKKIKYDILFIGNDLRRDYRLLVQIAERLPQYSFAFVTKHLNKSDVSSNVALFNGSWRDGGLSDSEIRDLYNSSQILINPIKPTLQPSGQSVTLQAMSCGLPILISKFDGFWEPEKFSSESIGLVSHHLDDWINEIKALMNDKKRQEKMSKEGQKITCEHYSSQSMINKYLEILHSL